jgi:transposase
MFAAFRREDCSVCQHLAQYTSSASRRRTVSIKPQPLYEALNYARDRQQTKRFKEQYKKRSGIEGTISQGVRAFGLRRTHYRGYAKTRLQHIAAATAMNLVRLGAWSDHGQRYPTHKSAFARAMEPMLA